MPLKRKVAIALVFLFALATFAQSTTLVDMGYNIVRDTDNGLEWMNHTFTRRNWADQTQAAGTFIYRGRSDWRLPTKTELLLLVSTTYDPKIDPLFYLGSVRNWTNWTSTSASSGRSVLAKKYAVFFGNGRALTVPSLSQKAALYVRVYAATGWEWNSSSNITWNDTSNIAPNN